MSALRKTNISPKLCVINAKGRKELKRTGRELRKSPQRDGTPLGS